MAEPSHEIITTGAAGSYLCVLHMRAEGRDSREMNGSFYQLQIQT